MKAQVAFGAVLCLWVWSECVQAQSCGNGGKPVCVKTVREPYYQQQCSDDVLCAKIDVPCGTVENRFFCNFDQVCVKHQKNCLNATLEEEPLDCHPTYSCEWKPFHEIDPELFSVRCTEYYSLLEDQGCGDAMAKFFLPWKVFSGFNPDIDCDTVAAGDRVCVHAYVESKRQPCGNGRCKVGERCLHRDCNWKPTYGEKCGAMQCPPGFACSHSGGHECKDANDVTMHGTLYFYLPVVGNSTGPDVAAETSDTSAYASATSTATSSSSSSTSTSTSTSSTSTSTSTSTSSTTSTTTISISTSTSGSASASTSTRIETFSG